MVNEAGQIWDLCLFTCHLTSGQITPCWCFSLTFYINAKDGDSEKNSCIINADLVSDSKNGGEVHLLFPLRAILIFSDVHCPES